MPAIPSAAQFKGKYSWGAYSSTTNVDAFLLDAKTVVLGELGVAYDVSAQPPFGPVNYPSRVVNWIERMALALMNLEPVQDEQGEKVEKNGYKLVMDEIHRLTEDAKSVLLGDDNKPIPQIVVSQDETAVNKTVLLRTTQPTMDMGLYEKMRRIVPDYNNRWT